MSREAGETVKLIKCLQTENQNLNPKTSFSPKLYVKTHSYNPTTGEVETSRSQNSLASQLGLLLKLSDSSQTLD